MIQFSINFTMYYNLFFVSEAACELFVLVDHHSHHCKCLQVYMFISSQRVAGCLVAEPIKEGFKLLSCFGDERTDLKKCRSHSATLQFGEISLQREVIKRASSVCSSNAVDEKHNGAIMCENEAIPAVCGIRAIWVTPSNRRKGIASLLLDAVR